MSECACGRGPVKVRSNGRSLGRCAECLSDAGGKFPVGTVRKHGRIWRRKTEAGWEPCNEDGTPLPPVVRGTLAEIMAKYRLVPAPPQLVVQTAMIAHVALPAATGPTARADDPETSKAAGAAAADPLRLTRNQARVLALLGTPTFLGVDREMTDGAIARALSMHPGTVSKRRLELQRAGLVGHVMIDDESKDEPNESPMVGLSPHGRPSYVWQITEAGKAALRFHAHQVA